MPESLSSGRTEADIAALSCERVLLSVRVYVFAAFYEASGASARNRGQHSPGRLQSPPRVLYYTIDSTQTQERVTPAFEVIMEATAGYRTYPARQITRLSDAQTTIGRYGLPCLWRTSRLIVNPGSLLIQFTVKPGIRLFHHPSRLQVQAAGDSPTESRRFFASA